MHNKAIHKVIMDVDPGIDDSLALLFASLTEQIELLGVGIVAGNVCCNKGGKNALHTLHAAGNWHTPVRLGAQSPMVRGHIAAEETHGRDGFGELHDTEAYRDLQRAFCQHYGKVPTSFGQSGGQLDSSSGQDAVNFMLESLESCPGEISILALGPLTNLALAWQQAPETLAKARQIIIMGGTARQQGNCSPVAEYNFWVDPHAVQLLLGSSLPQKVPMYMLGLDVTHRLVFSPNLREIVRQWRTICGPLAQFVYELTRFYIDFHWLQEKTVGCVINDPLVPVFLLQPELLQLRPAYVEVCTEGAAVGQSVVDFDGLWHAGQCPVQIAMGVDVRQFFQLFLATLFPQAAENGELDLLLSKEFC